ncbi:MAG: S-adenosylmethionine--diacylglycerol 3-amino-3-carboxypropyl transferase [Myxococcales bacterium]|nr:S-adenosylmethionine--diacylglycerol 3-amino-3-carboxypropyl transferase [Myxococcales bacterium]
MTIQFSDRPMRSDIAARLDLSQVRYAQVWEDDLMVRRGLEVGPEDDVLSITSAGDNVLALLLCEPRSITAVDMSPAQSAALALKLAAIRALDHDRFVQLLGWRPSPDRLALYQRVRPHLSYAHATWWDAHQDALRTGVAFSGRLERYLRTFQTEVLSGLWTRDEVNSLFEPMPLAEQARRFHALHSPAFEEAFRWYFGREMMERNGRDPAQFAHVEDGDVGGWFHRRFVRTCTTLPLATNHYMSSFLRSQITDLNQGPLYLRPDNFPRLRRLLDRVTLVTGELEQLLTEHPRGRFSKANLSNIFEYMSPEATNALLGALARHMRPAGRLVYWNLLVPRHRPPLLAERLRRHRALARRLWSRDRSWFYRDFQIEEVVA